MILRFLPLLTPALALLLVVVPPRTVGAKEVPLSLDVNASVSTRGVVSLGSGSSEDDFGGISGELGLFLTAPNDVWWGVTLGLMAWDNENSPHGSMLVPLKLAGRYLWNRGGIEPFLQLSSGLAFSRLAADFRVSEPMGPTRKVEGRNGLGFAYDAEVGVRLPLVKSGAAHLVLDAGVDGASIIRQFRVIALEVKAGAAIAF